jgi:hypothetical protein
MPKTFMPKQFSIVVSNDLSMLLFAVIAFDLFEFSFQLTQTGCCFLVLVPWILAKICHTGSGLSTFQARVGCLICFGDHS